jgi:hypothetical protein
MLEISTATRSENKVAKIDGIEMTIRPAGAGKTLGIMQKQKQMASLSGKKELTDAEMATMQDGVKGVIDFYKSIFTGHNGNDEDVANWVESQDFETLQYVLDEVKKAENGATE